MRSQSEPDHKPTPAPAHAPEPTPAPAPAPTIRDIPTSELISELLNRYTEGIFIGYDQTQHYLTINNQPTHSGAGIDVNSKLDRKTGMGGVLVGVLTKMLAGLTNRQAPQGTYATCMGEG